MDQGAARLRVFERIRKETVWLRLPLHIFEDVVQEAWLLVLDYAQKTGKDLDDLSKTELRFRCLEAKRKVSLPYQEKVIEEGLLEAAAFELSTTEEIVKAEAVTNDFSPERLAWFLKVHPILTLTDHQRLLWDLMRQEGKHGWQAAHARQHSISRQAIARTVSVIRNKVKAAAALLYLAEGRVDYFFNRYGRDWNSPLLKITLKELLRPQLGIKVAPELLQIFLPLQGLLRERAADILKKEIRFANAGDSLNHENLAMGFNIFYLADLMAHSSKIQAVAEDISAAGTRIGPIFDISFTLYRYLFRTGSWIEAYIDWLGERLASHDTLGRNYANYHVVYYRAIPAAERERFLQSAGKTLPKEFSYPTIISSTYNNIRNSFYEPQPRLLDVNFLRFLLIKKHFPLDQSLLPLRSQHALKTLAEKALHSREPLVVQGAEEIIVSSKV